MLRLGVFGRNQQWQHATSPLLRRLYSAETSSGRPIALNIVDPWLPPPFPSRSLSTEWERLKKRLVRTYVCVFGLIFAISICCTKWTIRNRFFKLSRELPGWKKPAFTALIQDKYVGMNEAFAA